MGWFLWRKPNPGFTGVQEIPLLSDVVFVGRGKDCTVHCLSLYVSRRHLKLIPKDDGSISLQDLGSSNGTFVNQMKIPPNAEFSLRLGDEIGIGNFNNDNQDCFVYEVRNIELSRLKVDSSANEDKQPIDINQNPQHQLERGLKRCADEPEIVVLDDDDDDANGLNSNGVESFSNSLKRQKIDETAHSTIHQSSTAQSKETEKSTCCPIIQEDSKVAACKDLSNFALTANAALGVEHVSSSCDVPEVSRQVLTNAKATHTKQELSSNINTSDPKCDEVFPQPSGRTIMNIKPEISFQKPANPRVSAILEGSCDSSTATLRLSSPAIDVKSNLPVFSSTPLHNKHVKLEDMSGLTPREIKTDEDTPSISQTGADFSPIVKDKVKDSSRLSQNSSANYTIDEELIPIDLCDDEDDDEIFPCSQMFTEEEEVKPCLETLDKEMGVVDLSLDEEPQNNILERDDDVVLISEDEDEEEIQEANKWFNRLSQSFIKVEAEDEVSNAVLPTEQQDDDIWEDWPKELENNDQDVAEAEPSGDLEHDQGKAEPIVVLKQLDSDMLNKMEEDQLKINHVEEDKDNVKLEKNTYKKESKDKSKAKDADSHRGRTEKKKKHRSKEERHSKKHSSRHRKHDVDKKESRSRDKIVERLKETFGGSSSEDEDKAATKSSSKTQSDINFDALLNKSNDKLDLSGESKQLQINLNRLEENPQLCERYGLSSLSPSTAQQPPAPVPKKAPRKIEIVDALPNPPRKASNRGISMETSRKMYDTVRQRSVDEPKRPKSKEDTKALRKEKLAKVAAHSGLKDSRSAEHKRSAPAKAKVTMANRGSFLTETDESSPIVKPKSRKEILESIKIPKLKDKAVVNLSTKSPLQALNLSYEKKELPQTSVQSNAEAAPVEIPTGPQPKKRVAQKPPPGFYEDTRQLHPSSHGEGQKSLPVPAEHSLSMKSCLSGSSKHNITMNDSKPIAQKKKRVQFKENLEEIRYIDKLPNTRKVNSSRDADRPTPMSHIVAPKLPKGPAIPNDESILQDIIYDISKWNPLWLKEEKDLPPDVVPPVVSNMVMPPLPKTEFLDFHEYHETMYPLLMLELWSGVSREYNTRMNNSRNNLIMAVDKASSAPVFSRPERMLTTLSCHMLVNDRPGPEPPRLGNLVIIDLALKDPCNKLVIIPVFGYVSFDAKDRLRNTDQFHKDLVSHCPNPTFKIRFNLQIKERKNFTFELERPMRIKHVKYLRGDLRMFQAMKNLEYMPLQYSVISPLAASEDFTLPDVSQKKLAFIEQLNPMQTQIVLQTAEVCLQDKPKICLIQGPPGTGKTQVIESLVMHLLYRDSMYTRANRERRLVPRILLCAPSNNAVDLLVARLLRRRARFEKEHRFKMVRVGQTLHEDVRGVSLQELANVAMKQDRALHDSQGVDIDIGHLTAKLCAVENQIRDLQMNSKPVPGEITFRQADLIRRLRVLEERKKQQQQASNSSPKYDFAFERETKKKILRGADIIGTTLNSCVIKLMETVFPPTSAGKYHFQVCIVDEATQCLEVETLIPLLLGVKTLVLVGDPNQLPATILSKIARDKGLSTSLFARLQNVVPKAVQMLDMQYRMHPEILKWPNKYFYHRRLKSPEEIVSCRDSRVLPYSVLSLPFHQDSRGESNSEEAKLVLQLSELLIDEKAIQHDFRVGIVTPYQTQRRLIESMIMGRLPKLNKPLVEVNTIDSCQGQEKDIIIISCVRTNGVGFLSDRQRINVALTRAKYAMFICGNFSSLDRDSMWNNLLTDARHRKCLIEVRNNYNKGDLWNLISKK
ncbi:probable helicase senataxin [Thrips palmi]|uniref:Probable helicase senataxin n=1 Tax=Thrips palmi TaxID=161013 RepID=A0A6P8ZZM6_THRPL|nr:probable helicase senataxin [Thrips palmi]XP_034250545.1 probable helicase senataxin [Thrips palmi]